MIIFLGKVTCYHRNRQTDPDIHKDRKKYSPRDIGKITDRHKYT